ncbi:MAG: hypothetical protein ACE5IE_02770 [Dehalococcoidia bacterium]
MQGEGVLRTIGRAGLALAVVLIIVGLILQFGLGYNVGSAGDWASGWFSIGNFSVGIFSAGIFSIGLFSIGLFSIGLFSLGIFSIGLIAGGIFVIALHRHRHFTTGPFMREPQDK